MKWEAVKNDLRHDELQTIAPAMHDRVACTADTALKKTINLIVSENHLSADKSKINRNCKKKFFTRLCHLLFGTIENKQLTVKI